MPTLGIFQLNRGMNKLYYEYINKQ